MFTHLHLHSHYSLLEAIGSPKAYVKKVKELGMEAVALTDYNGLYGALEFYKACQSQEIKPIIGVEMGLVHDITGTPQNAFGTIVLLAKNNDGYQDLLKLVSEGNMQGYHSGARIDFSLLKQYGKNLIAILGGPHSFLGEMILQKQDIKKQKEIINMIQTACGEGNVYLEITARDESLDKNIKKINQGVLQIHSTYQLPLVCSNNVHHITSDDAKGFQVALAIKDGKRVYDETKRKVVGDQSLLDEQAIKSVMIKNGYDESLIDTAMQTTNQVATKCTIDLELDTILFPNYTSPDEIQALYEANKEGLIQE